MRKKSFLNEKGQVIIFVTLAFVILGLFVGLAVDGGRAYLMHQRLRKVVDAAALAGAKAMAGPTDPNEALNAARIAACDSAKLNGIASGDSECGQSGTVLTVWIGDVTNPDGTTQQGVIVRGANTSSTFFMRLGGLIGCESCTSINVEATGQAAPDTLVDVVLVLDDTGTMNHGCVTFTEPGCPIRGAKEGAKTLVNKLLADPNSHAKIAFVPFRGCYTHISPGLDRNNPPELPPAYLKKDNGNILNGCIFYEEMQDLTNDSATLAAQIDKRRGAGGYPGTNVCLAMHEGRKKLFGTDSRAIARKIMVILTDGDQTYSDYAFGAGDGIPNLGDPIPHPYPQQPYLSGGIGDKGSDTSPGSCMATTAPGNGDKWGPEYDQAIDQLDVRVMAKASTLKDPAGDNVEIYVLRFSDPTDDSLTSGDPPGSCDPALIGTSLSGRENSNDMRDRNLSRCLASNTAMGDPFAVTPNDHYFYAALATDINTKFQAIATNILKKRRLVA